MSVSGFWCERTTGDRHFHWRKHYYGCIFWLEFTVFIFILLNHGFVSYKYAGFHFTRHYLMAWSCMAYCDAFISSLNSYSDGTHSLQMIYLWASDVTQSFFASDLKQADLHIDWHVGELIFRKVLFLRKLFLLKSKKRKHFRFFFCSISGLQLLFWSVLCNAPLDPSCAMISKACHVVAPPKHPKEIPECSRKWVFGKLLEDMLFPTSHPGFVSIAGLSLEPARHLLCQTQWGRKRKSLFCSHVATVALYTVEY